MRAALLSVVLAFGCEAGEVGTGDEPGLAKPVEPAGGVPLPAVPDEGAASPTTPAEAQEPSDTPAAAPTSEGDAWDSTRSDPWATTKAPEEVTASPALPEPEDPWTRTSRDPWAPTTETTDAGIAKQKKPLRGPIR